MNGVARDRLRRIVCIGTMNQNRFFPKDAASYWFFGRVKSGAGFAHRR